MKKSAQKISAEGLRTRLKLKNLETRALLAQKHPHVERFFKFRGIDLGKIRERSAKILSTSALAGALLLAPPMTDVKYLPTPQEILDKLKINKKDDEGKEGVAINKRQVLKDALATGLPKDVEPLTRDKEKFLEQIFVNTLGIPVRATLEGEHLNTTYGYIGQEQHLRLFPGDSIRNHGSGQIQSSGMAPGLGAWGYFADSKSQLTSSLEEKEKWYAVVQTLYLADWNRRQPFLKDWFKYRKVIIINVQNGSAVVADVADSGPAAWTGKQFGGSPEVMNALGGAEYKKGAVIVFFVDDPNNKIPLGPVEYN